MRLAANVPSPAPNFDYSQLQAPTEDGGVLVAPRPAACVEWLRENATALRSSQGLMAGVPLAEWRNRTRRAIAVAGDRPLVVVGHQPAFIHPGVWAKYVVACRLANAIGGTVINLVVDNDSPPQLFMDVPTASAPVELRRVRFADVRPGCAYEQIPVQPPAETDRMEKEIRQAMADRFASTLMPEYLAGFRAAPNRSDWVDQSVAGRRAIDRLFGVAVEDRRVSRSWWTPLLADMLLNARRFAETYNSALLEYRQANKVRGANRPIPDLVIDGALIELPLWAYRRGEPRQRLAIRCTGDSIGLVATGETFAAFPTWQIERMAATHVDTGEWMLRPRALTLTIWARLLLADLFIHGIGGAKYDRISDSVIRSYYGLKPPSIACVSATLRWDARRSAGASGLPHARHELRDIEWNPHRHVADGHPLDSLLVERRAAVNTSSVLREREPANRRARRDAFNRIRDLSRAMAAAHPDLLQRKRAQLAELEQRARESRILGAREYFFALYRRCDIERLACALPAEKDFRV